ncbi:alpha/beta hydrolase family protein [Woodsholea maritima]|uniref:alpha/beta hydrolase family protein n=1 Tax=Woodsholea maritima TaxID=240237 RepID=UPI00035C5596|nr:alpha/beta fold hydrolase [Woodsholea maritima]
MKDVAGGHLMLRRDVHVQTTDGRVLAARLFAPHRPRAVMLINSATGFRKEFYEPFASASARAGWAVLTYDYRGIGASREGPARKDNATMLDWGVYDMPAAARALVSLFPGLPFDVVAHSVGGHFLSFLPKDLGLRSIALLSSGSGYWGRHAAPSKYMHWAFWRVMGPIWLATRGMIPKGVMWRGDDLPPGVFKQWRDWGVRIDYFRDAMAEAGHLTKYQSFTRPIRAWVPEDDPIATRDAVRWLLNQYPHAPSEMKFVRPKDVELGQIGHAGLFHPKLHDTLWPHVWRWLDGACVSNAFSAQG